MKTKNDQIGKTRILRATIGIITRGGPVTYHESRPSNPVLLRGMELPNEASYVFSNPTNQQNFVDKAPISIGLFFGENGWEGEDVSLGEFQLKDFLPAFPDTRKIEIKLAVSADEILSITLLDRITWKYRSIGFIDISNLAPPEILPKPKADEVDKNKLNFDQLSDQLLKPKPRETGKPHCGRDISQELTISFEEALYGKEKEIEVVSTETCPSCTGSGATRGKIPVHCVDCQGTGLKREGTETGKIIKMSFSNCPTCQGNGWINPDPCRNCQGNGWVKITRLVTLHIPACIDSGAEICLLHQGEPGRYGGYPGHLRISTYVALHPLFSRTNGDITISLPVSASFAKQGGYLRVPDVKKGNSFLVNLPAGVKNDMTFQVSESEEYTLAARIEIYYPAFLFAQPGVRKHLQTIKEWIGKVDYELPAQPVKVEVRTPGLNHDLDGKTHDKASPTMRGSKLVVVPSSKHAIFYTQRGMIYEEKKDFDRALADYNKALELDPEYANAYDKRGSLYLLKKDLGEALANYNKALELDPDLVHAYTYRGTVYFMQNRFSDAVEDFEKSLFLDSGDAYLSLSLGQAYQNLGETDKAIASYKGVLNSSQDPGLCRQARLLLAYLKKTSDKDKVSRINEKIEPNRYVSFEELYRNAPTNFTDQKDWEKWENEYLEKGVKGKGRFVSASIHPQVGKIFFIVSVFDEEGISKDTATKVAFLLEDAQSVKLGDKEGSFLFDGIKWIQIGENYIFEGRVSEFSLLDPDLVNPDKDQLIIIKGKKTDIEKE